MLHDFGWAWILLGPLFWIVVIGLVIYAVVTLNKKGHIVNHPQHNETPLEIIKKRYAKGELTREQFEQMKKDLGY